MFKKGDIVTLNFPSHYSMKNCDMAMILRIEAESVVLMGVSNQKNDKLGTAYKINGLDSCENSDLKEQFYVLINQIFTVKPNKIHGKTCELPQKIIRDIESHLIKFIFNQPLPNVERELRDAISSLVEIFYNEIHNSDKKFVPGENYIHYGGRVFDEKEIKNLVNSSLDFWLTAGNYAKKFNESFCKFLTIKHSILTNSGSSANLLAISALTSPKLADRRLKPGDEVITTACAFPTTVGPLIQNGLTPVFLDIDIGTYNIQAEKVEDAITDKTKAISLAHTLGNPFNLEVISRICREHDLWLVEDNCDALGSQYNNKYTGTFGDIATFSFYPAHHITMGEGGALTTNDSFLKVLIESFRDWGRDCWCEPGHDDTCKRRFQWQLGSLPYGYDHKYIYSHIGYNLKVTDMQAAVGLAQLEKLNDFIKTRKHNWNLLYNGLKEYEDYFILPKPTENSDPSWFGFLLTVRKDAPFSRNDITNHLEDNQIATRLLFSGNIIRHPCFDNVKYRVQGDLKNTDTVTNDTFWLGVYPGLNEDMLGYILEIFEDYTFSI